MSYSILAERTNQETDNYNNSKEELIAIEAEIQKWEALREQIADANIAEAGAESVISAAQPVGGEIEATNSPLVDKFISDVKSGNIDSPTVIEAAEHLSGVYAEIVRDKKRTKEQQKKAEEIVNLLQVLKTQTLKEVSEQKTSPNANLSSRLEVLNASNLLTSRLQQNTANIDLQNVVALRQNQVREVTSVAQNNILQQQLNQLNTVTNQLATNLKAADMFMRQASQNAVITEVVSLNQAIRQNVANATALNASRVEINNIVASQQQAQTQATTQKIQQQQVSVQQLQQIQEKVAVQVQQIAQNATKMLEQVKISNPQLQSNIQEIARQTSQIAERAKQLETVQKISEVAKVAEVNQPAKGGYAEVKQTPEAVRNAIQLKSPIAEKTPEPIKVGIADKTPQVVKEPVKTPELIKTSPEPKTEPIKQPEKIGGDFRLQPKPEPIKEKIEVKSPIGGGGGWKEKPEEKPTGKTQKCDNGCPCGKGCEQIKLTVEQLNKSGYGSSPDASSARVSRVSSANIQQNQQSNAIPR